MNQQSIRAILGFLLLVPAAAPAAAQQPPDLPQALARVSSYETVTIMDTDGRRLVGRITAVSSTGLTLTQQGKATAVPLQRVARITIKDASRNGARIGALIGAGIGIAGGAALNAICANEGGECLGVVLALGAVGAATGAGIGWVGDRHHQSVVYARPGAPREFSPELRVRVGVNKRSGVHPALGVSWSRTGESGLGFEVNAERMAGAADGAGRGFSIDGRALYAFGRGRVRPYLSGGLGYGEHHQNYTYQVPPSPFLPNGATYSGQGRSEGFAPVLGGGVRIQPAGRLVIRPEVTWSVEPTGRSRTRRALPRAGVSVGAAW